MKIYIASSWKNQHAVEMLTDILREKGHEVISFVEKAVSDEGRTEIKFDFVQWINSPDGLDKFKYDIEGATESDLVVYLGPAGTDAWAEVGAAFGAGVTVFGLWAKGEPAGLTRKMVVWFHDYRELIKAVGKDDERTSRGVDRWLHEQPCRRCRVCGCTQGHACEGGCSWVEEDLCSACQ